MKMTSSINDSVASDSMFLDCATMFALIKAGKNVKMVRESDSSHSKIDQIDSASQVFYYSEYTSVMLNFRK